MDDRLARTALGEMSHASILNAMPLPHAPHDEEIRHLVLDIIFRCLVRGEGAYALGRASGYELAALRMAKDLRRIRDRLFFRHRTETDYVAFLQQEATQIVERLNQRIDTLEAENNETADYHEVRKALNNQTREVKRIKKESDEAVLAAEAERDAAKRDVPVMKRKLSSAQRLGWAASAVAVLLFFVILLHWAGAWTLPAMDSRSLGAGDGGKPSEAASATTSGFLRPAPSPELSNQPSPAPSATEAPVASSSSVAPVASETAQTAPSIASTPQKKDPSVVLPRPSVTVRPSIQAPPPNATALPTATSTREK